MTPNTLLNFSLMCLNLRFGLADDGDNDWQHRKEAYPSLLKSYPADFYLFQEANDFQISFLNHLLADHYFIGQRDPAPDYWQSNVIFYHRDWCCVDMAHFYLSATPEKPSKFSKSRWPRQCTLGTFQRGPQTVMVINTHFDFENEVQCRSAELICSKVAGVAPNRPIVLAGDFNADVGSDCYSTFTSGKQGFKNAFEPPHTGTFHGFSGAAKDEVIDWILYRGEINVHSVQVIQQRFGGRYPSDHFPLLARFNQAP